MTRHLRQTTLCALALLFACGSSSESPTGSDVDASVAAGVPKLALSPHILLMGPLEPGWDQVQKFILSNNGDAPLQLDGLTFIGAPVFTLEMTDGAGETVQLAATPAGAKLSFDPPLAVPPQGTLPMEVTFKPDDIKPASATIFFVSNDPSPFAPSMAVNGNNNLPCLTLKPANKVAFGTVKVGSTSTREVVIDNCGAADLVVTTIELDEDTDTEVYALDFAKTVGGPAGVQGKAPTTAAPLVVPLGGKASFSVVYSPDELSPKEAKTGLSKPDSGGLRVLSDTFNAKATLAMDGVSVTKTCPTAKVVVQEGDEVMVMTPLHLSALGSMGSDGGPIVKWQWTVTTPSGVAVGTWPNGNLESPTYVVKGLGEYSFCLDVWDAADNKSCAPSCAKVQVLVDGDIHVELTWDTPGDADQADTGPGAGANMDLHFAHPLANGPDIDCSGKADPWYSNPFDTFWFNPNPNWGSASPAQDDDPKLLVADDDGAGPEAITLDNPEGKSGKPSSYAVGVHYWNDHGFGASTATVKLYIKGVLATQVVSEPMNALDMWYVGRVMWPNDMSDGTLAPLQVCYQTPGGDPCAKTGKMWQPQGDDCIKACYWNPAFTYKQGAASMKTCKK